MKCVRKYLVDITFDDLEWIMHTFQRRCDVQSVPTYANLPTFGSVPNNVLIDNKTYVVVQNDKDDMFFKIRFPNAVLVEQTWTDEYFG